MVEEAKTGAGQNGTAAEEEKKHDVEYADAETAGQVSDIWLLQTSLMQSKMH